MLRNSFHKEGNLKSKYGISLDDYNKLLKKQKGRCALCLRQPRLFSYDLGVDHCHKTGRIRGLLCNSCNQILTEYRTLDYFKRVVSYLDNDVAKAV